LPEDDDTFNYSVLKSAKIKCKMAISSKLNGLLFFGIVMVSAIIGTSAFMLKIVIFCDLLIDPLVKNSWAYLWLAVFGNQVVGSLNVAQLLLSRVEAFAFGGSDAFISVEEQFVMNMYLAALFEKVWKSNRLNMHQKIAIMLHFDDDDVQQLMIEEDQHIKSSIVLSVRQYMKVNGHEPAEARIISRLVSGE